MATRQNLTLRENNDETIALTITAEVPGYDLTAVTRLEFYLKINDCYADTDPATLLLSSTDPSEMVIVSQDAAAITATVQVPASALSGGYDRFYHLDALTDALRRTALYGQVIVVDL